MNMGTILLVYGFGWAVTMTAFVDAISVRDMLISAVAALFWPILVPARILRKLIN